jgi:tricorn protease
VYFLSDRDGVMNVWSMDEHGSGVKQETHQKGFDIEAAFGVELTHCLCLCR